MRVLSSALNTNLILKKKGVEPVRVLGIEWTPGTETLYSDRKINGQEYPFPTMSDLGGFNTTQVVNSSSSTQNVSVVLSDIQDGDFKGKLKDVVDCNDVHKVKARVYLMVQGVQLSDKTLLFQGEINSPLEWDESDRTLSFDIISQVESTETGFAIEDGDFPNVPEELRGKPWPMIFGDVCWEKTQRVRSPRKGFLVGGQGVIDFTLAQRLCQATYLQCALKYDPPRTEGSQPPGADECIQFRSNFTKQVGCLCPGLPAGQCAEQIPLSDRIDKECLTRRFNEICKIIVRRNQELALVVNPMQIRGGAAFPQNQILKINIEGVVFTGRFSGENFTWSDVQHPQADEVRNPPCKRFNEARYGWRNRTPNVGWNTKGDNGLSNENVTTPSSADCNSGGDPSVGVVDGAGESWRYFELFEAADFIWLRPGSEVFLEAEAEILHIANLFGGTITGVAAYRKYGEQTLLVSLPTDYYSVRVTDYGAYNSVSEIVLTKPLKTYKDEEWEEDIYVTARSNVGPNPADCIKFLVDTYLATSGITMDPVSYAAVQPKLENYPIGMMVTDRPSVFDLIGDIAYQSRLAAVVRDGEMVLIYLAEEPTPIRTLTMADILPESVRVTHGDTEDLKTKHEITWKCSAAPNNKADEAERRISLKWNIPLYGTSKVVYDYYTQNTFETVLKSATFWMIREATTWQRIHFETPLTQIDLDAFDAVALNIPQFPANTTVIVEDSQYNADTNTIKFRCWTPIRAGEKVPYTFAWPAAQDSKEHFPLTGTDDGRAGDALGFNVTPPLGHILAGGFSTTDPGQIWAQGVVAGNAADRLVVQTTGDRFPSDIGDTLAQCNCPVANDPDITVPLSAPTFSEFKEIANRQDDHFENNQSGFGGGNADEDEDKEACGSPHPSDTCTYEVTVITITPEAVTTTINPGTSCPGGGPCGCGSPGRPCYGPTVSFCHTFGALWAAQQFMEQKNAEATELWDNCRYECGKSDTWQAGFLKAIPGSAGYGECENGGSVGIPGDPDAPGAGDGEINEPTPTG